MKCELCGCRRGVDYYWNSANLSPRRDMFLCPPCRIKATLAYEGKARPGRAARESGENGYGMYANL